ncbi:hypothetical protein Tco_0729011 [Tanacetum coccineum]|uniref:Retroviral polymerase SH3-like domain-containing protein n=1 Tax=Tanacetum coccineum TaxID=301880 RepID=A0ABQ4YNK9_9ASTR
MASATNEEQKDINGKKYILVIVEDYTRFGWGKIFLFFDQRMETPQAYLVSTPITRCRKDGTELFMEAALVLCSHFCEKLHCSYGPEAVAHMRDLMCIPTNDYDDVGKLKAKADIGIFVGYAPTKKAYRIYNKRTRKIQETVHVAFDELTEGLTQDAAVSALKSKTHITNQVSPPTKKQEDDFGFQWFDDDEAVPITSWLFQQTFSG